MWGAVGQQRLEGRAHDHLASAFASVTPLGKLSLDTINDGLGIFASKYLPGEAVVHDVVALEAMQIRKIAQQIGGGNYVLTRRSTRLY